MPSPPEIQNKAFVDLLADKNRPISDAVQKFTRPVNEAVRAGNNDLEGPLRQIWQDLIIAAGRTPHSEQDRLVLLVLEIQKQPGPVKENGDSCKVWEEPAEWRSLPVLGPAMRECWNNSPKSHGTEQWEGLWPNINAFTARITSKSQLSEPRDPLDYSLYGIWTLRDALEDPSPEGPPAHDKLLQAAAVWMIYAADTLRERSAHEQTYHGKVAREGESLKEKEWNGCNEDRWRIWTERFKQAEDKCAANDTKDLLKEAIQKMADAERKKRW